MRQFVEYKFLRQKPIDSYIVDFYCSKLRLVIEIDGDSHAEAVEYDAVRTKVLEALGLTVIRYTNDDVLRNIAGVYDDLWEKIQKLTPPNLPLTGEASMQETSSGEFFSPPLSRGVRGVSFSEEERDE